MKVKRITITEEIKEQLDFALVDNSYLFYKDKYLLQVKLPENMKTLVSVDVIKMRPISLDDLLKLGGKVKRGKIESGEAICQMILTHNYH